MAEELYRNPAPTVDVIIETATGIVLIERRFEPEGWAIPGGFIDYGESAEDAARREAGEETGLVVELTEQFHTYSDPSRDPRKHTIATVFIGRAEGRPEAGDDAASAEIFEQGSLPRPMAFDHERILAQYFRYRATGQRPTPG